MKKLLFILFLFLIFINPVFADAVYDTKGSVVSGKIDGVVNGLIQIKNKGALVTFIRKTPNPVYKDIVEAKTKLFFGKKIKYFGTIIFVDSSFVKILCEDVKVVIPRYRVKNIEMYLP